MTLDDLHVAEVLMVYFRPVLWLVNSFVVNSVGHVLHLDAPHRELPGAPCVRGLISA